MARRTRGTYYAEATKVRENGRRYGVTVARQARTFKEARAALDADGSRGIVQVWSERTQQRYIVAERDEAGNWWAPNPFTGNLDALD